MSKLLHVPVKDRLQALDFGVVEKPLFMQDGRAVNRKAILNAGTGEVLGIASLNYKVIRYSETIVPLVERLSKLGWETPVRSASVRSPIRIEGNGARAYVELFLEEAGTKLNFGGGRVETLLPRIVVRGSYDTTRAHSIIFGDVVKWCMNGAVGFRDIFSTSIKHVGEVEGKLERMEASIGDYLSNRENISEKWAVLAQPATDKMIKDALAELDKRKAEELERDVAAHAQEAGVRRIRRWDVYQAVTNHLTYRYKFGEETRMKKERAVLAVLTEDSSAPEAR